MHNLFALRRKHNQDSVEQSNERPRCDPFDKFLVVPPGIDSTEYKSSRDRRTKGDPKKNPNTTCNDRIGGVRPGSMADNIDEENCKRRVQHHLKYGIHSNQYRTVFLVATGKTSPDQNLK